MIHNFDFVSYNNMIIVRDMELFVELDEGLKLSLDEDTSIRKEEACRPYAKNSFRLSTFLCQKLVVYVLELNSNSMVEECQTCIQILVHTTKILRNKLEIKQLKNK
jgi:hypothetical protein